MSVTLTPSSSGSSEDGSFEDTTVQAPGTNVEWVGATVGRGVVANRAFDAGDVLFEEKPLAAAVIDPTRCDYTFAPAATVRSSMTTLRFSSKDALHAAWKEYFKKESKALSSVQEDLSPAVKTAMRICWRGEVDIVGELETHWDSWSEQKRNEFIAHGKIVSEAAGRGGATGATPE